MQQQTCKKGRQGVMFDYFVSLGSACPIASSMGKYGLRSFSGPFDWLVTQDFSWVLHYMETDFKDFLQQENLEEYGGCANYFYDKQSGIRFLHDIENFEHEYEKLKDKYDRRIERFLEKTRFKVCYLRSVHTKQDVEYIVRNAEYIEHIIKKNNSDSEIVFLCNNDAIGDSVFPFRYYNMRMPWRIDSEDAMRAYFDHTDDFLAFCGENYAGINLMKNLQVDFEKYGRLYIRRYKTLAALLAHDFSKGVGSDKVIIYGAGVLGRELYKKIKDLTSVICFIDWNKIESDFEGIPIIQLNQVKQEADVKVIVSAAYDFENIKMVLADKFQDKDIISLDNILNLTF